MLFNSPEFIFGFLPITLLGFFLVARWSTSAAVAWLTLASLVFYGWWNPAWLPLMLASMAFNFSAGREMALQAAGQPVRWRLTRRRVFVLALTINLLALVYFKYAAFFANSAAWIADSACRWAGPELPLGISFFTFTQIAYLVDVYQGKPADSSPVRYGLFVTYYPHLVAGPILHHQDMMPQFARPDIFRFSAERLADGLVVFILGLFKKTVLADSFATYADPAFGVAGQVPLGFFEAWSAAIAYTFQIYFDFSGYSDMAIGLAMMIGVTLPANFDSPYKSRNIADFWRRWHMSLSRFLRDYLYIPLGGNRLGLARQQTNLMVTMLLGGLWHGAGWTFIVWGGLHGAYLMLFHAWERANVGWRRLVPSAVGWALTFLAVVIAWVFFRAADLPSAVAMLEGMSGANGARLPEQLIAALPVLGLVADGAGKVPHLADGSVMGSVEMAIMLAVGLAIVLATPNLARMRKKWQYLLVLPCAALALQRVLYGKASPFLYFQF